MDLDLDLDYDEDNSVSVETLIEEAEKTRGVITIKLSVVSGFESTAVDECLQKIHPLMISRFKGRIILNIHEKELQTVFKLRSIDFVSLVTDPFTIPYTNKKACLQKLQAVMDRVNWGKWLALWAKLVRYRGLLLPKGKQPHLNTFTSSLGNPTKPKHVLTFCVSCNIGAKNCPLERYEIAQEICRVLCAKFNWKCDLSKYDLNINVDVAPGNVINISFGLVKDFLYHRNLIAYNYLTTCATTAYNMLRLSEPVIGDIVMDPLCGSAAISIEGSLSFPHTFQVCGDRSQVNMSLAVTNLEHLKSRKRLKIDAFYWEVGRLTLRDHCIDIIITELPFGIKSTVSKQMVPFYSIILEDFARVLRRGTGRVVIISSVSAGLRFLDALDATKQYWTEQDSFRVCEHGVRSIIYVLLRKDEDS